MQCGCHLGPQPIRLLSLILPAIEVKPAFQQMLEVLMPGRNEYSKILYREIFSIVLNDLYVNP